jgi:hypothetical protein
VLADCLRILGPDHPATIATRATLKSVQEKASVKNSEGAGAD